MLDSLSIPVEKSVSKFEELDIRPQAVAAISGFFYELLSANKIKSCMPKKSKAKTDANHKIGVNAARAYIISQVLSVGKFWESRCKILADVKSSKGAFKRFIT